MEWMPTQKELLAEQESAMRAKEENDNRDTKAMIRAIASIVAPILLFPAPLTGILTFVAGGVGIVRGFLKVHDAEHKVPAGQYYKATNMMNNFQAVALAFGLVADITFGTMGVGYAVQSHVKRILQSSAIEDNHTTSIRPDQPIKFVGAHGQKYGLV